MLSKPQPKLILIITTSRHCRTMYWWLGLITRFILDLLHKSHSVPVLYPTMQYFVTEMCACAHILIKIVHSRISVWDLWNGDIYICDTSTTMVENRSDLKGMAPWWSLLGLLRRCPIFKSSPCNAFERRIAVDFIYDCPIFKWDTSVNDSLPG